MTIHRIRRQHWQVTAPDAMTAFALRSLLRRKQESTLLPALAEAFDAVDVGDRRALQHRKEDVRFGVRGPLLVAHHPRQRRSRRVAPAYCTCEPAALGAKLSVCDLWHQSASYSARPTELGYERRVALAPARPS